jgi:hypothetical protein
MRIVAKTAPTRQAEVARELRARVKMVLDAAGVAPAGPDTIVVTTSPDFPAKETAEEAGAEDVRAAGAGATGVRATGAGATEAGAGETAVVPDEDRAEDDEALAEDQSLAEDQAFMAADEVFTDEAFTDADEALARDAENAWSGRP